MDARQQADLILDILRIINEQFDLLDKIPHYMELRTEIATYQNVTLGDASITVYESILMLEASQDKD